MRWLFPRAFWGRWRAEHWPGWRQPGLPMSNLASQLRVRRSTVSRRNIRQRKRSPGGRRLASVIFRLCGPVCVLCARRRGEWIEGSRFGSKKDGLARVRDRIASLPEHSTRKDENVLCTFGNGRKLLNRNPEIFLG